METKIFQLESLISDHIMKDNGCHTHFDYVKNPLNGNFKSLRVTTYNPKKDEKFLLKSIEAKDEIEALSIILEWVKTHTMSDTEFSHTILWAKRGETSVKTYISHFYAKDALDALLKFYHDKDRSGYIIYEVKINPIS